MYLGKELTLRVCYTEHLVTDKDQLNRSRFHSVSFDMFDQRLYRRRHFFMPNPLFASTNCRT